MQIHEIRIITSIGRDADDLPVFFYEGFRIQVPPDVEDVETYILDREEDGQMRDMPNHMIWPAQANSQPKGPLAPPALDASDGIVRTHDLVARGCAAELAAWKAANSPEPPVEEPPVEER